MSSLAEARSHSITPEQFLRHDAEIREAKREKDDAGTAFARARKAAKNGAVDLKAYKFVEQIRSLDDDEQIVVMRHMVEMLSWLEMPIGTQFSLIDAPKTPKPKPSAKAAHSVWAAGEAGLLAGREGDPADSNPHQAGSEQHVAWARKHLEGLSERVTAADMDTEGERVADTAEATRKAAQGRGRNANRGNNGGGGDLGNARTQPNGGANAH